MSEPRLFTWHRLVRKGSRIKLNLALRHPRSHSFESRERLAPIFAGRGAQMNPQPLEGTVILIAHVAEALLRLFGNFLERQFLEKDQFHDLALSRVEQPQALLRQA